MRNPRVAFIHDWLTVFCGAEKVLEALLEIFPGAPVHTLVYRPESFKNTLISKHPVHTSFIEKLPKAQKKYRLYLPLMPLAVEQFDLSEFDMVISSSSAVAKGVITGPDQLHISYVHSPIRYAWDLQHQYLRESGLDKGLKSWIVRLILHKIRLWDTRTANGVDEFVTNSRFVARRIRKVYGRTATVIYPPVDVDAFSLHEEKDPFYLTVSRLVPYKKVGLIMKAFAAMPERRLVVIGDGPDYKKLAKIATPNVELLGYQDATTLRNYMQRARAFVFASEEDFGIVPVEAQACGTPVIAYGKGGVLETVKDGETGIFFFEQSEQAILDAIREFERNRDLFEAKRIRRHAEQFSRPRFQKQFSDFVNKRWRRFQAEID